MTEDEVAAARRKAQAASPSSEVATTRRGASKTRSKDEKPPPLWRWFSTQIAHTDPAKAEAARVVRERWDLPSKTFRSIDRALASEDSGYLIAFRQLLDEYRVTFEIGLDDDAYARETGMGGLLIPFAPETCESCTREAIPGTGKCGRHGGAYLSPKDAADLSRRIHDRILTMSEAALRVLQDLMDNGRSEQVRMMAATSVLDRAGIGPHMNINHTGEIEISASDTAAAELRVRLERIAKNIQEQAEFAARASIENTVDAEVVAESEVVAEVVEG